MTGKKWLLVIVAVAIVGWFAVSFITGKSAPKETGALPKIPAAVFEITQGNWQFYADSYQSQGSTVILSDYWAMVEGKWKHIQGKDTILSGKNGEVKIRRLTQ